MIFFKHKEEVYPIGKEVPLKKRDNYRFMDTITVRALKTGHKRMMIILYIFLLLFCVIEGKLFYQTIIKRHIHVPRSILLDISNPIKRADILDRNNALLAASLPVVDLYVDARYMPHPQKMANDLMKIFPSLGYDDLIQKLSSKSGFKYLKRTLAPKEQYQVNMLGYPQLNFVSTERRIYPQSELFSHLIGFTDVDNQGIAGLERQYEQDLTSQKRPLVLSVDTRLQDVVHTELKNAIEKFRADGGVAIVMNANTAEVLAISSMPDFDLNKMPIESSKIPMNKFSSGMYELGSVMKPFTVAFGLESGLINVYSQIEAHNPYKLARGRTISDFQAENRVLSVPEVLIYSSNIGTAKIAQMLGSNLQKSYLDKFHFLTTLPIELPEKGRPIVQKKWDDVETATIGYGYGIAVSPLHLVGAFAALVNGGLYQVPTFIKDGNKDALAERVISPQTSAKMRVLLRGVVEIGSGKRANIKGLNVIGKTGTAQMQDPRNGQYIEGKVRTSFIGAFPMDKPEYIVYVMIENPAKREEDWNFNTAGWNACPTGGKIIEAIAPILDIEPKPETQLPEYMQGAYEYYEAKKKKR